MRATAVSSDADRSLALRERGASIVELMATLVLLSIVIGAVYAGIASISDAVQGSGERLRNLDEARVLMAATTKDVRTAVRLSAGGSPFVLADDNEAVFYANLDTTSDPKKVRVSIDSQDQLIEEVWTADAGSVPPDYTYTGAPAVRFVGRYIANQDAGTPIFTYLDADGAALSATPLSADDLLAIKAVRVTLVVKKSSVFTGNPTTLVNRVRLPNLDYNAVAGQ